MALLPLNIPAGFYRNGTDLEQSGRWREGSLVRWLDGSLRPIGGWSVRKNGFTSNPVRGMHSWQSNNGTAWLAGGSSDQLVVMTGAGVAYDITPDDLADGRVDAGVLTGYGYNFYGTGVFGQPRPVTSDSIPEETSIWVLDNFGEQLIALSSTDGRLLVWDLTTTVGSELIINGDFATDSDWTKNTNWSISASGYAKYDQYMPTFNADDETIVSPAADTITITGHDFADGDEVTYNVPAAPASALGGLTDGTNYFIISATANTFQLSATSGGSAIDITANPEVTFDADDNAIKDTVNDKIIISNTFTNGDYVTYTNGGGVDIGGLTDGSNYYIVGATASEFQLSATSGGAAIDLTPDASVTVSGNDPSEIDVSNNKIVTSNTFSNGDQVVYDNGGGLNISGLANGQTYTVANATSSEFQLNSVTLGSPLTLSFDGDDATVVDTTNNKIIHVDSFLLTDGDTYIYRNGGGVDIGGLTDETTYFIVNATFSDFQLSATSGGSAITLTDNNSVTVDATDTAIVDATNDKIIIANTFSDGEIVTYDNGGGTDIAGLTNGTDYYIINSSTTEFQLSTTSGGSAVDITGVGTGTTHVFRQDIGSSHSIVKDIGASHTFDQLIGNTHNVRVDVGDNHQLERINFGNLDQTVSGLVATPDAQDSHDFEITLIDPDADNNTSTRPVASVKVVGTTSTTELINETLVIGRNEFRFGSDDTEVKIEIIPDAYNTPEFWVDNVTLKKKTVAEPITNAPIDNKAHVVTEERFLFALGAGGNSRKVQWCDKEDINTWTAAATNEAGDIELATAGQIMQGIRTRAGTLVITDIDAHLLTYVGPPYVYSAQRIATHCGAVSRFSAVATDQGAFWYGQENFFYFDGNTVQVLPCEVHDYVFGDFNDAQQSKVWGYANGANNEVWWYYCSANSTEIDRYVAYDYREKHWLIGNMSRTAGVSRGVFAYPFLAGHEVETITLNVTVANDSGNKFYISTYSGSAPTIELIKGNTYIFDQSDPSNTSHPLRFSVQPNGIWAGGSEWVDGVTSFGTPGQSGSYTQIVVGDNFPTLYYYCAQHSGMGGQADILEKIKIYQHEVGVNYDGETQFAETGPISLGNGDTMLKVNSVIPDEKTQGDVQMTFKTRFHPNDTERSYGPFDPTNPTSLRFTGRQIRMRVTGEQATDWRVGVMRLNTKPGGRR
jgi:hypothetical protein